QLWVQCRRMGGVGNGSVGLVRVRGGCEQRHEGPARASGRSAARPSAHADAEGTSGVGSRTMETISKPIDTLLLEERRFPPPSEFAAQANAQPGIYDEGWEAFWEREGRERVSWFEPFETLLEWKLPYAKWYLGGKLNIAYNCVDRHVEAGLGDKVAYHWEGEPEGDRRTITFADLQREVVKCANALKQLGVRKGTPVAIYMGMVPETAVSMLACARLGAPHTVVFGGFSSDALADR